MRRALYINCWNLTPLAGHPLEVRFYRGAGALPSTKGKPSFSTLKRIGDLVADKQPSVHIDRTWVSLGYSWRTK